MRTRAAIVLGLACLIGGGANAETAHAQKAPAAQKGAKIEPKARQVLHDMSEFLARQKAFEVDVKGTTDVIQEDGQKVQMNREGHVSVERPNKARADRKGDLANAQIYYDGKTFTVYAKNSNAYAVRPAPATIDATIEELYDKLGMELGPGDLLVSKPEKALTEDATAGKFMGESEINGVKTNHISVQGNEVDFELWVAASEQPLPFKYVITSKKIEGAPQYSVSMMNWKLVSDIPDETFKFTPPKDAQKVSFVDQIKTKKQQPKAKKE